MKTVTVQSNLDKAKDTFVYIKNEWIKEVLSSIGIDFEDLLNVNEERSVIDRAKLKTILKDHSINVDDTSEDTTISIFDKDSKSWQKIGYMEKPIYRIRQDLKQIDKNKRLFSEIEIKFWSVFDEEE